MTKINFCVVSGFPWGIQEVRNERKWVTILLGNFVQPTVVDTKAETAVLLPNEENRSSVRRIRGADKSDADVLLNEVSECLNFCGGKGVHTTRRGRRTILKVDFQVNGGPMRRKCFGLSLTEDICEFMIIFGDCREIYRSVRRSGFPR
jgi:hypothetical protein